MTVKGFFIWCSRSKKIQVPLEGKREIPSYFKIKPIIQGEEKKNPSRLLYLTVTLISGLVLTLCNSVCLSRGCEILLCWFKWRWRQQRLTIEKSCCAPVALRTPDDPPGGEDLTLSPLPAQTQQSQAAPLPQWDHPRVLPGSPLSFPDWELSVHKVLVPSAVLELLFNPSLWNATSVFPCHKNKPFLLFFLVSLKINKEQALQNHKLNTVSAASPWKVCLG